MYRGERKCFVLVKIRVCGLISVGEGKEIAKKTSEPIGNSKRIRFERSFLPTILGKMRNVLSLFSLVFSSSRVLLDQHFVTFCEQHLANNKLI